MCVLPYFVQKCSCPLNNADVCLRLCPNEPEPYITAVVKTQRLDSARPKMLFKMLYRKGLQNLPDHFIVSICQQCPFPYCSPVMPLVVKASLIFLGDRSCKIVRFISRCLDILQFLCFSAGIWGQ